MTETAGEGHATTTGADPVSLRREIPPVIAMAGLFVLSLALAIAITPTYAEQEVRAFENPESLANPIIYLAIVIAFTFFILLIARYKLKRVLQFIILGAVFMTINYVFWPLFRTVLPETQYAFTMPGLGPLSVALSLSMVLAVALVTLLYYYPEWYVIDTVGVVVSAGAAGIFGISFGLLPSLLLLVAFATYDAIAVYRTKHMLDLADNVMELRLPIMFVVPKSSGYSFLRETRRLKEQLDTGEEREAMFMGLGDVVIPGILVISSLFFLNPANYEPTGTPEWLLVGHVLGLAPWVFVALLTVLGSLAGYAMLMVFVLRGNPQAGLPLLNGGAILGFFLALLPIYGLAPLTYQLCGLMSGLPGC